MFTANRGVGFQIKFPNGVVISVQFGQFHYCNNNTRSPLGDMECATAEVALFLTNDCDPYHPDWITSEAFKFLFGEETDDVVGYVKPEKIPDLMVWAKDYEFVTPHNRKGVKDALQ